MGSRKVPMTSRARLDFLDHFKLEGRFEEDYTIDISYRFEGRDRRQLEKKWHKIEKIGEGTFGEVWLQQDRNEELRALKRVKKRRDLSYEPELEALAVLSQKNKYENLFVQFKGWYDDRKAIYIAMEYFPLGDLVKCLDNSGPCTEDDAREITRQVLEGLKVMHELGFTHRDLKPKNIFVQEERPNWWIKIGDFGISKRVRPGDTESLQTEIGTRFYLAPEVGEEEEYTNLVDIWSLSCIVYELLTQRLPFRNYDSRMKFYSDKTQFPVGPLRQGSWTKECIDFVQKTMVAKAELRLTAVDGLEHPWIKYPHGLASYDTGALEGSSGTPVEERPQSFDFNDQVDTKPQRDDGLLGEMEIAQGAVTKNFREVQEESHNQIPGEMKRTQDEIKKNTVRVKKEPSNEDKKERGGEYKEQPHKEDKEDSRIEEKARIRGKGWEDPRKGDTKNPQPAYSSHAIGGPNHIDGGPSEVNNGPSGLQSPAPANPQVANSTSDWSEKDEPFLSVAAAKPFDGTSALHQAIRSQTQPLPAAVRSQHQNVPATVQFEYQPLLPAVRSQEQPLPAYASTRAPLASSHQALGRDPQPSPAVTPTGSRRSATNDNNGQNPRPKDNPSPSDHLEQAERIAYHRASNRDAAVSRRHGASNSKPGAPNSSRPVSKPKPSSEPRRKEPKPCCVIF